MGFLYSRGIVALAAMMGVLSGCASIIDGRTQRIDVNTNPPAAECGLYRDGMQIATIRKTPGGVLIDKSKSDIWIVCVKEQFQQALYFNHSGVAGSAFVNIIGGIFTLGISTVIGVAVDSGNGSDNMYQSPVNVSLVPAAPGQPQGPTALPDSFSAPKPVGSISQQTEPTRTPGQQFDGLYRGTIELGSGQFRPLEIKIVGTSGTGTAAHAACPAGNIEVTVDPAGQLTGTAEIATGSGCTTQKEAITGTTDGERMRITLQSRGREFTLSRVVASSPKPATKTR